MENGTEDIRVLSLGDFNDQEVRKLLAPIIYLAVLMTIGIPGNLIVMIIYRYKYSQSVYKTIIWNLALTDLLFCTITIPFNIGRLIHYYTFAELWVCKMFTTFIIVLILYSSHLLVTLSIHRFKQNCMPLRSQITPNNIQYWMIGGFCLAVVLDIPQGIMQPLDQVKVTQNITGHVCAVSYHFSIYSKIYNGFLTFLFSVYSFILFILYTLIGRKMYLKRQRKHKRLHASSQADETSCKITKIAVTVSAVFALSYVPLFVIQLLVPVITQQELSSTQFAILKVCELSYVINHVANPFIYAFHDRHFRKQFVMMISTTERRKSLTVTPEGIHSSIADFRTQFD